MKQSLWNDGWRVKHLSEEGEGLPVTLPDDAMLREKRSENALGGLNVAWFEGHDYCYRKSFFFSVEEADKHHVLEFEGVYRKAEVWINGEKAAFCPYGYTNFYVDCDPYCKAGENIVEVIARNADQPNSRWYSGAGIYRPVRMWTSGQKYIALNGIKIKTVSLYPHCVEVTVKTSAGGLVTVTILDGKTVLASASGTGRTFMFELDGAVLWNCSSPVLYTCRVEYADDISEEHFGIRSISWGKEGFLINGEREILRGACVHHDNGLLGAVCDPDALERRIRILKDNGYNALRSAHNPCSKTALDICDRIGMYVMDEYIDHWYIHKTYHDYVEFFDEWWRQDLTDMADKDYNHPCVILYSTGNEVAETAQPKGIALAREMTEFLHELDATRPVTCGINIFFNFLNHIGFGQYSDEKAEKEAERNARAQAEGKKAKERSTGSKFFNDMAGIFGGDFMKLGAALHGSDVTTRDAFANMDIAGYNYGEKRYKKDLKKYPDRLILGSETFCFDAYKFWELAKKEKHLIGDFVWSGIDYLGEVGIGSWEYSDYAPRFDNGLGWISAGSGRIDLTGKPLGEALYTKVAFEREKGPYLAVRPLCHEGKHHPSAWKMTNAMPSWSWRGYEKKMAHVEVYARASAVELFLNGTSKGKKPFRDNCLFTFRIPYENGVLEAVSYDEYGNITGRDRLETAEEKTILRLAPEADSVKKGHLAFIRLSFTDPQGILKPAERGIIRLHVEGGKLRAFGSACPYYERSYLDPVCDTYYGEALAVIEVQEDVVCRAESKYGSAEIKISSDISE